jgi:hypothetical protein
MTATDATAPTASPHPVGRVATWLGAELFFYFLAWAGIAVLILAVSLGVEGGLGSVDGSTWEGLVTTAHYVLLAGGIGLVVNFLPMYVAYGITRRHFLAGALPVGVGLALLAALAGTLVFALEGAVFDVADWRHVLENAADRHIYDRPDQYGLILPELAVQFAAHLVSGMLIGAAYYRLGGGLGTLLIVPAVVPAVVSEMALGGGWVGVGINRALDLTPPSTATGLAIAIAATALGAVGVWAVVRDMPIENQQSWWR